MHLFQICVLASVPVKGNLRNVFLQGSATTLNHRSPTVSLCLHNLHTCEFLLIKALISKFDEHIFVEHVPDINDLGN